MDNTEKNNRKKGKYYLMENNPIITEIKSVRALIADINKNKKFKKYLGLRKGRGYWGIYKRMGEHNSMDIFSGDMREVTIFLNGLQWGLENS